MKTRLIELLESEPVEFLGRKKETHRMPPMIVEEESKLEDVGYSQREVYTFRAIFGARFVRHPNEYEAGRLQNYRDLLASVADGVYYEVRNEVRKLLPLLAEIDCFELREDIEEVVSNVINMTEVDR